VLIHLLSDYIKDPKVRKQFSDKPEATLEKYGLPREFVKLLQSGNKDVVVKRITDELNFHAQSSSQKETTLRVLFWGGADITVTSISPNEGKVNTPVDVTISGANFPTDAQVVLQRPGTSVEAKSVKFVSATKLQATVQVAQVGTYDVVVKDPSTGTFGTLVQGFTATANTKKSATQKSKA
jgi:hypothetical protein